MEHERQHWIPKAYLSAWCDPDPARQNPRRIHRYRKSGSYKDHRPPRRIFSEAELYTRPNPDGTRNLGTEHALTRLEDAYTKIRDRVLAQRNPISGDERRNVLLFTAALRLRSPEMRDHDAAYRTAVLRVADSIKESLLTMTPEQRRNLPRSLSTEPGSRGIPLEEFRRLANRSFGETLTRKVVIEAQILDQMYLSICLAQDRGETLITSDAPVVWWDPTDPPPSRRPLGLGRRAMEVTLPLTPTMCARITHLPSPAYVDIDAAAVDEINMRTLHQCRDFFLSEKPSLTIDWLDEP